MIKPSGANRGKTIRDLQIWAIGRLKDAQIPNPQLDARLLLQNQLQGEPADLIERAGEICSEAIALAYRASIEKRIAGMPVFRIIGYREFYNRRFYLNAGCLEPRGETELLVERVLKDISDERALYFADIGVGSGAIIISLLAERQKLRGYGSDISADALKSCAKNAEIHGVSQRMTLNQARGLSGSDAKFDFIVSNPPYIRSDDIKNLQTEVKDFDPVTALDGGADGLDIYREILAEGLAHLKPKGRLYLETGHGQHSELSKMAEQMGWGVISTHLDFSRLERIIVMQCH